MMSDPTPDTPDVEAIRARQLHAAMWSDRTRNPQDHDAIRILLDLFDQQAAALRACQQERDALRASKLEASASGLRALLRKAEAERDALRQRVSELEGRETERA